MPEPTTAIVGSAILGAGTSIVGANKASKAQKQATQAQSDAARRQEQLSREIYYDQRGLFQPYYQAGLQGLYGNRGVMALLGMGGGQAGQPMQPQQPNAFGGQQLMFDPMTGRPISQNFGIQSPMGTNAFASIGQGGQMNMAPQGGPDWSAYLAQNPDVAAYYRNNPRALAQFGGDLNAAAAAHYQLHGQREGRVLPQIQTETMPVNPFVSGTPGATVGSAPVSMERAPVDVGGGAMMPGGEAQPMVEMGPAEQPVGPMTASLRETPGYQFLQDEQKRALENSFAARGKLLSGGAMRALQERSMGLADQTYQQAVNNAMNLVNIGTGARAQIGNAAGNYGSMAANAFGNIGAAQAQGAIGRANAWNQGAQGVAGSVMGGLGMYGGYRNWGGWGGGGGSSGSPMHTGSVMTGGSNPRPG
jgi:hypothetical protein